LKFAKPLLAIAALSLLFWASCPKRDATRDARARQSLSPLLAAAPVESLSARYAFPSARYPATPSTDLGPLPAMLKARHWLHGAESESLPLAWCPATQKGAFFRHGWVWACDGSGKVLKSLWFEPDLKAGGSLEWSLDGTQLRLRADGWRHALNLDLTAEKSAI
jgi:hypothetical protein